MFKLWLSHFQLPILPIQRDSHSLHSKKEIILCKQFFQFSSLFLCFDDFLNFPFLPFLFGKLPLMTQFSEKPLYIVMNFVGKLDFDKWWTAFQKNQKFHKDDFVARASQFFWIFFPFFFPGKLTAGTPNGGLVQIILHFNWVIPRFLPLIFRV